MSNEQLCSLQVSMQHLRFFLLSPIDDFVCCPQLLLLCGPIELHAISAILFVLFDPLQLKLHCSIMRFIVLQLCNQLLHAIFPKFSSSAKGSSSDPQ